MKMSHAEMIERLNLAADLIEEGRNVLNAEGLLNSIPGCVGRTDPIVPGAMADFAEAAMVTSTRAMVFARIAVDHLAHCIEKEHDHDNHA